VRGIDVSSISASAEERELIIIPPGVIRVKGTFMLKGHLTINVELVNQPDATYLSSAARQAEKLLKLLTPPTISASVTTPSGPVAAAVAALTPLPSSLKGPVAMPVVVFAAPASTESSAGGSNLKHLAQSNQSLLPNVPLSSMASLSAVTLSQPFTNELLKEAVKMWCENKSAAAAKFGDISTWNTSQVTSMRPQRFQ
jgi:hypothetical protein